ncbi:MAG: sigma-54-dependent Fis family transcriptional regulator [Nitrospiraceae bacterium]|nr:MAG: sigma-54-dependent Fis family transcriptional regulator [Nitrospiraceae bacterium]
MQKLKIILADDDELIRHSLEKELFKRDFEVSTAENGKEALKKYSRGNTDLLLLDYTMPVMDGLETLCEIKKIDKEAVVIMLTAMDDAETAVKAMKAGAHDYIVKPFSMDKLLGSIKNIIKQPCVDTVIQHDCNVVNGNPAGVVYRSEKMAGVMRLVSQVIVSMDMPVVLLQGETGTGKNLVAGAIHNMSERRQMPFVEINCGALPDHLLESELFGHEKGAFTDARTQKKGLFEIADGGTLFLDEIGEIKMDVQIKLLRLIEEKKFRRLGGTTDISADVNIVAATNKNLSEAVRKKEFREDLYYRLNVIPITIPPLRDRKEDIVPLSMHFMGLYNKKFNRSINEIPGEVLEILLEHDWPGNIRELRNIIEKGVLLSAGPSIRIDTLPVELRQHVYKVNNGPFPDNIRSGRSLEEMERNMLLQALGHSNGNQSQAARMLNIGRDALRRRMKKYDLFDSNFVSAN